MFFNIIELKNKLFEIKFKIDTWFIRSKMFWFVPLRKKKIKKNLKKTKLNEKRKKNTPKQI